MRGLCASVESFSSLLPNKTEEFRITGTSPAPWCLPDPQLLVSSLDRAPVSCAIVTGMTVKTDSVPVLLQLIFQREKDKTITSGWNRFFKQKRERAERREQLEWVSRRGRSHRG